MFGIKISPTAETNIKSSLVLAGVMTMVGVLGSFVAGTAGVIGGIGLTFVISAATMWFSRELALWLMNANEVKPEEKPEGFDLRTMIDKLRQEKAIDLKVMPKVCIINSNTKNAFATGRHSGHTAIAITTGLLKAAKDQAKGDMKKANRWIEAIMLHELGHIVNGDIATKTVASILVGSVRVMSESLYKQRAQNRQAEKKGKNKADKNEAKDIQKPVERSWLGNFGEYLVFNWIIPYTGSLLALCLSRTREYAADDVAAKCDRAKDMAEAFELLRKPIEGCQDHSPQMKGFSAMMCASLNPEADQKVADRLSSPEVGFFESLSLNISQLFSTHPPLDARIKRMRDQEREKHPKKGTEQNNTTEDHDAKSTKKRRACCK